MNPRYWSSDVSYLHSSSVGINGDVVSLICSTCTITVGGVSSLSFRCCVSVCPWCICTGIASAFISASFSAIMRAYMSVYPLKISDHVSLGYLGHLLFLPSWKYVEYTLESTDLPVQKRPVPSCWGSLCRCETCPHDIWGGWYTPSTPQGCWTYLLPFLWTLQPYSYARPRYPSLYSWCQSGRGKMNVSGLSKGMYFLIPEFIHLMPWIPLVPVILDFHNLLLQKLIHIPPLFTLQ